MTRVVLLPSAYLPTLGGVQELTRHLALALAESGDDVEIWTTQHDGINRTTVERLDDLAVRRFPLPLPRSHPASFAPFVRGWFKTIRAMRAAVEEFRPDVLHVQCFGPNGAYATSLSHIARVPLVVTLQGETVMDDQDIYRHSVVMRTALRIGLRRAALVTACSAFTLRDAETRFGLVPGRGRVIFNGVVVDEPVPSGSSCGSADVAGRYVLALGRVVEKKGFDLLLRGFSKIASRHPSVDLTIGGEGPALPGLRQLAKELSISERIHFLGRLSRTDVARTMRFADIFVMPSRLEPFGIVVLEAWRAGRPVIATEHGGPPEFVEHGKTGLLVDPFDPHAVEAALDRLLSDEAFRRRIGQAGEARVMDFEWSRIASNYRDCYAQVIGPGSRAYLGP